MVRLILLFPLILLLMSCVNLIDQTCTEKNKNSYIMMPGDIRSFFVSYSSTCNPSGILFEPDKKYVFSSYSTIIPLADGKQIRLDLKNGGPLTLKGWSTSDVSWWEQPGLAFAGLFRPKSDSDWYVPLGKFINTTDGSTLSSYFSISNYYYSKTKFTPDGPGQLFVITNDLPCCGRYKNNEGVIKLTVECMRN